MFNAFSDYLLAYGCSIVHTLLWLVFVPAILFIFFGFLYGRFSNKNNTNSFFSRGVWILIFVVLFGLIMTFILVMPAQNPSSPLFSEKTNPGGPNAKYYWGCKPELLLNPPFISGDSLSFLRTMFLDFFPLVKIIFIVVGLALVFISFFSRKKNYSEGILLIIAGLVFFPVVNFLLSTLYFFIYDIYDPLSGAPGNPPGSNVYMYFSSVNYHNYTVAEPQTDRSVSSSPLIRDLFSFFVQTANLFLLGISCLGLCGILIYFITKIFDSSFDGRLGTFVHNRNFLPISVAFFLTPFFVILLMRFFSLPGSWLDKNNFAIIGTILNSTPLHIPVINLEHIVGVLWFLCFSVAVVFFIYSLARYIFLRVFSLSNENFNFVPLVVLICLFVFYNASPHIINILASIMSI